MRIASSAYVCPPPREVVYSCTQLDVFPLICDNPNVNIEACNEVQCNQPYIDNYAACQCLRSRTEFYEHSENVGGLIRRCGGGELTNPFGDSRQHKPVPTSDPTSDPTSETTAQPVFKPTASPDPIQTQSSHISGGAIAGIVLGIVAAMLLAVLLAFCWRSRRRGHIPPPHRIHIPHGPTHTVISEKFEPIALPSTDGCIHSDLGSVPETPVIPRR
ncbi:hypothetical protein B0O80DRAFT_422798 [Mortierella sp. GBAus27b]|nr:hypothetical protein B0O80DRAFT_422798 [Mortierella sp. GBAus27b]